MGLYGNLAGKTLYKPEVKNKNLDSSQHSRVKIIMSHNRAECDKHWPET